MLQLIKMNIKYFNNEDGNYYDVTGATGSTLVIGANGFETKSNKKYLVAITQSATDAPIVTIEYINTIGEIVWTRNSAGNYNGYLSSAFIGNVPKLEAVIGMIDTNTIRYFSLYKINGSNICLRTWLDDGSTESDDILKETTIEISIY